MFQHILLIQQKVIDLGAGDLWGGGHHFMYFSDMNINTTGRGY